MRNPRIVPDPIGELERIYPQVIAAKDKEQCVDFLLILNDCYEKLSEELIQKYASINDRYFELACENAKPEEQELYCLHVIPSYLHLGMLKKADEYAARVKSDAPNIPFLTKDSWKTYREIIKLTDEFEAVLQLTAARSKNDLIIFRLRQSYFAKKSIDPHIRVFAAYCHNFLAKESHERQELKEIYAAESQIDKIFLAQKARKKGILLAGFEEITGLMQLNRPELQTVIATAIKEFADLALQHPYRAIVDWCATKFALLKPEPAKISLPADAKQSVAQLPPDQKHPATILELFDPMSRSRTMMPATSTSTAALVAGALQTTSSSAMDSFNFFWFDSKAAANAPAAPAVDQKASVVNPSQSNQLAALIQTANTFYEKSDVPNAIVAIENMLDLLFNIKAVNDLKFFQERLIRLRVAAIPSEIQKIDAAIERIEELLFKLKEIEMMHEEADAQPVSPAMHYIQFSAIYEERASLLARTGGSEEKIIDCRKKAINKLEEAYKAGAREVAELLRIHANSFAEADAKTYTTNHPKAHEEATRKHIAQTIQAYAKTVCARNNIPLQVPQSVATNPAAHFHLHARPKPSTVTYAPLIFPRHY